MPMQYACADGIGIFTFDNGRLNLGNMELWKQFYHHLLEFEQDDDVIVGVITGQGDNFCAGDDLKEIRTAAWALTATRWDRLLWTRRRTKPVVAAANGYALGGGFLALTLMADIRIAGESLQTGAPEIAYGMGGISGATRLGLNISPVDAAYLALTGEKIDARQAVEMRLVNEVVPDEQTLARAMEVAALISRHPRQAVQTELDCLHRGMELSRADALHYADHQYWLSRKLLGQDADAGKQAIATMKNQKKGEDHG
ncbi:MAG: enoyl-CoA hydratase/isomerase family protein [Halioglobus sp.]